MNSIYDRNLNNIQFDYYISKSEHRCFLYFLLYTRAKFIKICWKKLIKRLWNWVKWTDVKSRCLLMPASFLIVRWCPIPLVFTRDEFSVCVRIFVLVIVVFCLNKKVKQVFIYKLQIDRWRLFINLFTKFQTIT